MSASSNNDCDVLVVGAGPTGLVLALWLTRMGVRVRIVDKTAEPGTTSRALVVQARTLELYNQISLAETVVESGRKVTALNLRVAGKQVARLVMGDIGKGVSPFPYALVFPQDEHERVLIEWLAKQGIEIERQTELASLQETAGGVIAQLKNPDSSIRSCAASYIAGCDGAHSTVRETLGIGFPGGVYEHTYYVADVAASGPTINGEVNVSVDTSDVLAVVPLHADGHARLIGTVRNESGRSHDQLSWNDVSQRVIEWMRLNVQRVNWFSTYRVHHRVAQEFRRGRAFLAGDAAHIHSPVGGQGMNTGIGDAVNLAWKLAAVLGGRARAGLLDTYEPERIAFARRLVATTDRVFTSASSSGTVARWIRMEAVPRAFPFLFRLEPMRRFMFRMISQTALNYRQSSLSSGRAGSVRGGDRLPWIGPEVTGGSDNFKTLDLLDWQVHVYGDATSEIESACAKRKLALQKFVWRDEMQGPGLKRNALYLVRPDGYVGMADEEGDSSRLTSYLEAHGIVGRG